MEPDVLVLLECIVDGSIQPRDITLSALQSITDNFSEERIIGEGGFGTVYKGVLLNGEVAVKRIHSKHTINERLFHREVNSLLMVNHKNIVRFLGFCSHTVHKPYKNEASGEYILFEDRERILCFEYINNGSLKNYIADELRGLQWDTRYSIIKGICEGLQYLHTEKKIMHLDLKPANILLDGYMVAKITDFGLSRMVENSQTKTATRFSTPGYTAPEYIDTGTMLIQYDVYSLGVIIIELVTGHRSIPDISNVLRRWRHRWHKSGEKTPFRYQQIAKLIEIGLKCQEKEPDNRPSISDILSVLNDLENTNRQIGTANESMVGQINPYSEDDMLGIEPLELRFPFKLDSHISCSLELTNETNVFFAFSIKTRSPLQYSVQPNKDIVAPGSKYSVKIILPPLDKAPQDEDYTDDFIVRSTKVNESLKIEDITEDIFKREEGKLVDEVNLTVTYKTEVSQVDVSLGPIILPDTMNLHGPQESNVSPPAAESTTRPCTTSNELIQFDPPELSLPFIPNKNLVFSVNIVNITDYYVGFILNEFEGNVGRYYMMPENGVMPPRSTQRLVVQRMSRQKEDGDMQCQDKFSLWNNRVSEGVKSSDIVNHIFYQGNKELSIVYKKTKLCPSDELIQFDPPHLCFPFLPCKKLSILRFFKIVNVTDHIVGFNIWCQEENSAWYAIEPDLGILPPQSTQVIRVTRTLTEKKMEDMHCQDKIFVWNGIVTEHVKVSDVRIYCKDEDKELPIVIRNTSPCTYDELIQFDPPQLNLPFTPNKNLVFSVNITNGTDYIHYFNLYEPERNVGSYFIHPMGGVIPPRSTRRIVVKRIPDKKEEEDMECHDKLFIWNNFVSEGVGASDIVNHIDYEGSIELPIVYNKTKLCPSDELIQFDSPHLSFPFLPCKRLSILRIFKIVNVTDHIVGFNIWCQEDNSAWYAIEPDLGILPPQSTQVIRVTRTLMEKKMEDMHCQDKIFVWNGIMTERVEVSDVRIYWKDEDKELPIVITNTSPCTYNELIQFDPPQLSIPFTANKNLVFSVNIANTTDYVHYFNLYEPERNVGWYCIHPMGGVIPPWSNRRIVVRRIPDKKEEEDMECHDKLFLWNNFVSEGVEASDIVNHIDYEGIIELPIVYKKTSLCASDELIQFDPPQLIFPFLPNQRLLMSRNFKIDNLTDQYVGFNIWNLRENFAVYLTEPQAGILPPHSTHLIKVGRTPKNGKQEDMQSKDQINVWMGIVTQGVEVRDLLTYNSGNENKELPVVLTKHGESSSR